MDNHATESETRRASGAFISRRDYRKYILAIRVLGRVAIRSTLLAAAAAAIFAAGFFAAPPSNELAIWVDKNSIVGGPIVGGVVATAVLALFYFQIAGPQIATIFRGILLLFGVLLPDPKNPIVQPKPPALKKISTILLRAIGKIILRSELAIGAIKANPEIIHCHDLGTLPSGVKAKEKTGARLVFDAHEIYEDLAQANAKMKRANQQLLKRYEGDVDEFITINDSIADFYAKHYPKLPPAVIIKNATLKADPFEYDGRMHEAAALPREQKILLYQGGFATKRGLDILVQSAQWLRQDWTLIMMGWGGHEEILRDAGASVLQATRATRKYPALVFLPPAPHEELAQWTAGGSIGVIPYERVGLNHLFCTPNKLWEYPNAGVPILCSPLVEMTKTVNENGIGWLLPQDLTPENLAATVNALSDSDIAKAGDACRPYLERDNWTVYEKRLLDLYTNLLK
ncbi:MAG: hypothetical protein COA62_11790 [Rhodobiaceae bacterium]|nr:MAG: hypothetical protein COA62_11790 [Rhodobiaceae bacterium]